MGFISEMVHGLHLIGSRPHSITSRNGLQSTFQMKEMNPIVQNHHFHQLNGLLTGPSVLQQFLVMIEQYQGLITCDISQVNLNLALDMQ